MPASQTNGKDGSCPLGRRHEAATNHIHTLGPDGFYACCSDPHVNADPNYDSSAAFVQEDDYCGWDTIEG